MISYYPHQPVTTTGRGPLARVLSREDIFAALRSMRDDRGCQSRRTAAMSRYKLWSDDYRDLVAARIGQTRNDDDTKTSLNKHITLALNVASDITSQVCVVWTHRPHRTVEGANEKENAALRRLLTESQIDVWAPVWNQLSFLVGKILVIPVIRNDRATWDTILPCYYDAVQDPDWPAGPPLAAMWPYVPTPGDPRMREGVEETVVHLDAEAWRYWAVKGGNFEPASEPIEHNFGVFPGVPLCMHTTLGEWYGPTNSRVVDATLDVSVTMAAMALVRKAQNHKLLKLVGQLGGVAGGQKADPEGAVVVDVEQGQQVQLEALDFDTSPRNFIEQIRFLQEVTIEAFGIPGYAVTYDTSAGTEQERLRVTHEGLTEIRDAQIPIARVFEHDLVLSLVRMARRFNHPVAADLPDDEKVRNGYRVYFPKLGRAFNDPNMEMEWKDWQLKKGLTSQMELMRLDHPTLTDEQIKDLRDQYLEEQSDWAEAMAQRNLSSDPDRNAETLSQLLGRQGGVARSVNAGERVLAEEKANDKQSPDGE